MLVLFALGAGCSQKFSDDCSNTRSCDGSSEGGEGGEGGADDGAGGTSSNSGGSSGTVGAAGASGGSGESCADGCGDDETCCDGQCVDTSSDAANCGACGKACEGDNAELACVDSKCSIASCEEGYVDCSDDEDGCETEDVGSPGAPAPFLPMAGAYTGAVRAEKSLKPKFAWRAPEQQGSCSGLTYEIELTRECVPGKLQECAFEEPDVHESGIEATEWIPSETLPVSDAVPVGALYAWRVRACDAPGHCSAWSRVSYVNVGRLIDDINADGYSDLVEVDSLGEGGWILLGDGATPLAGGAALTIQTGSADGGRFVGDVNGDEFPDMVIWDSYSQTAPPRVLLGASSPAAWTSLPVSPHLNVRYGGARVGDLDGDGFAEVAISEFGRSGDAAGPSGVVRVYRGRSSFTLSGPINVLSPAGTTPEGFGAALDGGLDSNADGFADIYVLDDEDGLLHLLRGGSEVPVAITASVTAAALVTFPNAPAPQLLALDRNGDGYGDVAVHVFYDDDAVSNSIIQVFAGGPEFVAEPVVNILTDSDQALNWVGAADLGTDGRSDLVLHLVHTFSTSAGYRGQLRVLPGSSADQAISDLVQLADFDESLWNYGSLVEGDYDGDGAFDLAMRTPEGRRLLRGGKSASKSASCVQPSTSFAQIGDWCSVASSILPISNGGKSLR